MYIIDDVSPSPLSSVLPSFFSPRLALHHLGFLPLPLLFPIHPPSLFPLSSSLHVLPPSGDVEDEEDESAMASAKEQKESELQVTCKLHNHTEFLGYGCIMLSEDTVAFSV